ncbi:MAG TPA: hypothetical protein VMY05_10050 [Acidobacteriota bacterium]|nr:hypothetical protein [Acidobacteriota bacterium]
MRNSGKVLLLIVTLVVLLSAQLAAQAPGTILYQGRLTNADGDPIVAPTDVKFRILKDTTASPEVILDTTMSITPDTNGVFTVELGPLINPSDWNGAKRFLGITVGTDAEMLPYQVLTSVPYALSAGQAEMAAGVGNNSVTSSSIVDGSIMNADISGSAAIAASKISGTAATLGASQTFTGTQTFHDSTMTVGSAGITIGNFGIAPSATYLMRMRRNYNTTAPRYGVDINMVNASTGTTYGLVSNVQHTTVSGGGSVYGVSTDAISDGGTRYGVEVYAARQTVPSYTGTTYGVMSGAFNGLNVYGLYADGGNCSNYYGIYCATASGVTGTNLAGYFNGSINVTGSVLGPGIFFTVDHPLDPENKYLSHSSVESPDMMNVYNGNVTTDGNGEAVVQLPDYFSAFNRDFRYQLTPIGEFAQAIVAEEISGNAFTIRTDKPNVKVSWQVTGIRTDAWAEANRMQVERVKPDNERGLYMHPEAFGLGPEKYINYEQEQEADRAAGEEGRQQQ